MCIVSVLPSTCWHHHIVITEACSGASLLHCVSSRWFSKGDALESSYLPKALLKDLETAAQLAGHGPEWRTQHYLGRQMVIPPDHWIDAVMPGEQDDVAMWTLVRLTTGGQLHMSHHWLLWSWSQLRACMLVMYKQGLSAVFPHSLVWRVPLHWLK